MAKTTKTTGKTKPTGKTRMIRLRVSPEHGERFEDAAKEAGASGLSSWLRGLALKASRPKDVK